MTFRNLVPDSVACTLITLLNSSISAAISAVGAPTANGVTPQSGIEINRTWFALPLTAGLTLGSATVAARRPMVGGLLLMISCAPAATIFWRELGFLTFGGAWLLGAWIYFAEARRVLKSPPAVGAAVEVAHRETMDRGAGASEATPIPRG